MNNRLLYLLVFIALIHLNGHVPKVQKWVVINGCSLNVLGSTNINKFTCAIANYGKPDTIMVSRGSTQPVQLNGSIGLDVQKFDCHNPIMTADLRKTLKSKEYPYLVIRFLSMSRYPDVDTKQDGIKGMVSIELSGVSKRFEVDYKVITAVDTYINLVGTRIVNFSDFNLTPPRKLGGMIRTDNELKVVFNLRVLVID